MFGGSYNYFSKENIKNSVGVHFSKEKSKRQKMDQKKVGAKIESFKQT